jgi:predicted MFS family arabinose efflux permease
MIGGYMAKRNFHALFIADAATTLVLAFVIYRAVPESRPASPLDSARGERVALPGSSLTPFLDPRFASFLGLNFLSAVVFFQHLTGLIEDMRLKGLSTQEFGLAVSANGLMIVLLQPWVSTRVRNVRRSTLLAVAAALVGLGFGLTTFATTLGLYVLTVAIWTMGEILFSPANASIVAEAAPAHLRGRYQGAYMITWSLAAVVSPAAGPLVMAHAGMPLYWGCCFLLGLLTAAGHLLITSRVLR